MNGPFIDTNIFLRHLLKDDPERALACLALFKAIEDGKVIAWTTDLAIAEVVWVLSMIYKLSEAEIGDVLLPLINLPGLKLPRKRLYSRVFEIYASLRIDYIDCYHAAFLETTKQQELYSYDTDFDQIPGMVRREP